MILQPFLYNPDVVFGPVVEKNSTLPFLDRNPIEIIASGDSADLPWVVSDVTEEGLDPVAGNLNFYKKDHIVI